MRIVKLLLLVLMTALVTEMHAQRPLPLGFNLVADSFIQVNYHPETQASEPLKKQVFLYSYTDNIDTIIDYDFDVSSNQWERNLLTEIFYDPDRLAGRKVYYWWDDSTASWYEIEDYLYAYDAQGRITLELLRRIDTFGIRQEVYKENYWYSSQKDSAIAYSYDINTNQWVQQKLTTEEFDPMGRILARSTFDWRNTDWVPRFHTAYTYTDQFRYAYLARFYNRNTQEWTNQQKAVIQLDASGQYESIHSWSWDNTKKDWGAQYLTNYVYDQNGNQSHIDQERLLDGDTAWDHYAQVTLGYDLNELLDNVRTPVGRDFSGYNVPEIRSTYNREASSGNWYKSNDWMYYYSDHPLSGLKGSDRQQFSIFPNPGNGIFTVSGIENGPYRVQVCDLTGRTMLTDSVDPGLPYTSISMNAGIYVITILDEKNRPLHSVLWLNVP